MTSSADSDREERYKHLLQPIRCDTVFALVAGCPGGWASREEFARFAILDCMTACWVNR